MARACVDRGHDAVEIAFRMGYLSIDTLKEEIKEKKGDYYDYIKKVIENEQA